MLQPQQFMKICTSLTETGQMNDKVEFHVLVNFRIGGMQGDVVGAKPSGKHSSHVQILLKLGMLSFLRVQE